MFCSLSIGIVARQGNLVTPRKGRLRSHAFVVGRQPYTARVYDQMGRSADKIHYESGECRQHRLRLRHKTYGPRTGVADL